MKRCIVSKQCGDQWSKQATTEEGCGECAQVHYEHAVRERAERPCLVADGDIKQRRDGAVNEEFELVHLVARRGRRDALDLEVDPGGQAYNVSFDGFDLLLLALVVGRKLKLDGELDSGLSFQFQASKT